MQIVLSGMIYSVQIVLNSLLHNFYDDAVIKMSSSAFLSFFLHPLNSLALIIVYLFLPLLLLLFSFITP